MTKDSYIEALYALKEVQEASGALAKRNIIKEYKDNKDFRWLMDILLVRKTGIKKLPYGSDGELEYSDKFPKEPVWLTFKSYVDSIIELKGIKQRDLVKIREYLMKFPEEPSKLLEGVITQKLRLGVNKKGYFKAINMDFFEVSLASPSNLEEISQMHFPVLVQEKLDGVRIYCEVKGGVAYFRTRQDHAINLPTIKKGVERVIKSMGLEEAPLVILDGELTKDIRTETAGEVNKLLKGAKGSDKDMKFNIFDCIINPEDKMLKRASLLDMLTKVIPADLIKTIDVVPTYVADNLKEVEDLFKLVRARGGEGLIVRDKDSTYQKGRTKALRKLKGVFSTTLKIVDLVEGEGKYKGVLGGFQCVSDDNIIRTVVGSGLTDKQRVKYYDESLIGKLIEVQFNELNATKEGRYFLDFPVFKGFREESDKTRADTLEDIKKEVL